MASATGGAKAVGLEALHRLKSVEPPLYLTQSPELSTAARLASQYLFSSLCPYAPKSPFNQLLTEGFDAEQIWQQIDLQAEPLVSSLKRHVRKFERNPEEIKKQFNLERANGKKEDGYENGENERNKGAESESGSEGLDDIDDDDDEEEEEGEEHDDDERENGNGVEDEFLKLNELEEYMMDDEAREYGQKSKRKRGKTADEEDEDDEEEDDEEDDEIAYMGLDNDGDEEANDENARYEDFFGVKKTRQRKYKQYRRSDDLDMDEPDTNNQVVHEPNDDNDNDNDNLVINEPDEDNDNQFLQKIRSISTHEKELHKLQAEIVEIEKANLEPKTWTMQGEVTAAKRPKNSALEVDLDFEHNVRPAPAITEEITASLEDIIKKRILEGRFDDVQKPPTLSTKAPREKKEMDENKSRKGLAELYEDDYAQKTGLVSAALSFSDEQKKEATMLFKKLSVKLDALSHFHFAPKPVIEDMTIQANVPALAMEEIAPLVVSDAAMLAPEEVFSGKGDIKEETELTKPERKRRRAKKKRIFKAESVKKMAAKAQISTSRNPDNGNEDK